MKEKTEKYINLLTNRNNMKSILIHLEDKEFEEINKKRQQLGLTWNKMLKRVVVIERTKYVKETPK